MSNLGRYLAKFTRLGDDECWPWTAATNRDGYGIFWGGEHRPNGQPRIVGAHRWGWANANGPIPAGLVVRHRCDNPPCQNPAHWLLGTVADNNEDARIRGRDRKARGVKHGNAQTDPDTVREIRRLYAAGGVSQRGLARQFGMSQRNVRDIIARKRWAHVE